MFKFLILFLCFQIGSPEAPLESRLDIALKSKKPILTIFSAKWCAPCQSMKRAVIEPMVASGELDSVSLIYVDVDKDRSFTEKYLGKDVVIPRILLFFKKENGWFKYSLEGYQSRENILKIIKLVKRK